MKKHLIIALILTLLLSLTACGNKESSRELEAASLADSLLKSGAFSVSLDELPASKAAAFYGVDKDSVADAVLYHAAGTSKEQIVLIKAVNEAAAGTMVNTLKGLVSEWIEADRDYAPEEVPKLEKAVLRQSGAWVVLIVANDPDTAAKIVGEYI